MIGVSVSLHLDVVGAARALEQREPETVVREVAALRELVAVERDAGRVGAVPEQDLLQHVVCLPWHRNARTEQSIITYCDIYCGQMAPSDYCSITISSLLSSYDAS